MHQIVKSVFLVLLILINEALIIAGLQYYISYQSQKREYQKELQNDIYEDIASEMKCFPIPLAYQNEIFFEDTYGAARDNGGHEGCDIMDVKNEAGRIPVVSATDGVITNVGWLFLGGYRIGITSEHDIYYYYAHLDSYAAGISAGKEVKAGELLGFMGNTGEGEEGTNGKFDVHLHFGIYLNDKNGKEYAINPYQVLQKLENKKRTLTF